MNCYVAVFPPRYDKSAFAGRGDRADPSTWPVVSGPLELVFFEGWMLGFKPVGDEAAGGVEDALLEVNRQLGAYQQSWDSLVDSWLVIRIADPQVQSVQAICASGCVGLEFAVVQRVCSRWSVAAGWFDGQTVAHAEDQPWVLYAAAMLHLAAAVVALTV